MQENGAPNSQRYLLAVVVLYGCAAPESKTLGSLMQILEADAALGACFGLVIFDNSPQPSEPIQAAQFPVTYFHDPSNPGLAAAYNFALDRAEQNRSEWLLLLDQDTTLTREFMVELVRSTALLSEEKNVASIVPKLTFHGKICSPTSTFISQLRHPYRRSYAIARGVAGIQRKRYFAFNSGATLRVSAIRSVGGFPQEYWLDYLDHAIFTALGAHGYLMHIMQSELEHESSQGAVGSVSSARQRNLLAAQAYFVRQNGSFVDRALYRIWLLRCSRILWLRHPDRSLWKETAMRALGAGVGSDKVAGQETLRPHS